MTTKRMYMIAILISLLVIACDDEDIANEEKESDSVIPADNDGGITDVKNGNNTPDGGAIPGCDVYSDPETGQTVIKDSETGKTWLRCPMGQTWDEKTCSCIGTLKKYSLQESLEACPDGYQLPQNEDFRDVVCDEIEPVVCDVKRYDACQECSKCVSLFGMDEGNYVTSDIETTDEGWYINIWNLRNFCHIVDLVPNESTVQEGVGPYVRCIKK